VVLDRAESGDIDTVMAAGRVLMESGRVTVVDEAQVRDRFAEAVAERVYRPSAEVRRWAELGAPIRWAPTAVLARNSMIILTYYGFWPRKSGQKVRDHDQES
jgi:hypothetical protein